MLLLMLLRNETGDDLPRFDPPPPLLLLADTRTIGELAAVGQSFTTDDSLQGAQTEQGKFTINFN